ncbi:MAG: stage II sporulation protein R [Clostridia bacterium]|nr:stage II sporulation protein R [Clostridia bacterium]
MKIPGKYIRVLLCLSLAALAVLAFSALSCREELDIYDKTLRLHILANSDTETDQAAKLKVRDAVLSYLSDTLNECDTKQDAENAITDLQSEIEAVARQALSREGMDHTVKLTLTHEYYPERAYEGISLPAGKYSSVRILIGEAEGQNWWCVLFPQVCTDTATPPAEKMAQVGFTPNQIKILTQQEEPSYRLKFKILELLQALLK